MIDNLTPLLDQLFWQYLCFEKYFDHLSFWGCSGDNMTNDIIFQKHNSPLAHYPSDSILEILATIQMNGPKPYHDIHISCLDYTR
jgi:hypothetical protein